ncbi:MAG: nucleoside kinase [Bullifex sp.]|nr:nucleoside kinase [Spirochaetales bacterium]MDY5056880.1 nucleoside kinase [Bullifex sp.]
MDDIEKLLNADLNTPYEKDPVVGALVNGELKSLDYRLIYPADVKPVRLFSPLGKRIYRHSLCFLLSYAASKVFPDRHLEIGHSLGDGYFFRFTDEEVTEAEVGELAETMREAVRRDLRTERINIPYSEAVSLFSGPRYERTLALLKTRNDSGIRISRMDGFSYIAYEPIVTRTSLLTLWELRPYHGGMLLRYPQSRDGYMRIRPFQDNPKLFEVFCRSARECRIIKAESLGHLNEKIAEGDTQRLIELSETMLDRQIMAISEDIKRRKTVKMVFIAGPSSSGKTTSSLKLFSALEILGYTPIKISLDDYYLSRDLVPRDEDGNYDYEVMEALDLELFRKNMADLSEGLPVHLPSFDFRTQKRSYCSDATVLSESSIVIVEGIHGLNPGLIPDIDPSLVYKIYISCLTTVSIDDNNRISTTDNRIIRRMIRDSRTRGTSATETLAMWPSVERGEKNHIFPYQNNADAMINSSLPYEIAALTPYAIPLLRSVKPESGDAYTLSRRLLKFLELCYMIPLEEIPRTSLLREFLGGSIYKAV